MRDGEWYVKLRYEWNSHICDIGWNCRVQMEFVWPPEIFLRSNRFQNAMLVLQLSEF